VRIGGVNNEEEAFKVLSRRKEKRISSSEKPKVTVSGAATSVRATALVCVRRVGTDTRIRVGKKMKR
jgi:hypothetical protein